MNFLTLKCIFKVFQEEDFSIKLILAYRYILDVRISVTENIIAAIKTPKALSFYFSISL